MVNFSAQRTKDKQIGTVTYTQLRVYDAHNAAVAKGSTHPIMQRPDGEVYFLLTGNDIEPGGVRFDRIPDMESVFVAKPAPDVVLSSTIQFHSRHWAPEEFAEFIVSDLCVDGPNKRMEITLTADFRPTSAVDMPSEGC